MTLSQYDVECLFDKIGHKLEMTPYENILHISEVGSFMWGMGNEDDPDVGISDHDIMVVYQVPTKTILRGESFMSNLACNHDVIINNKRFDFSYMEVSHFVNLLIKGNINAIWALTSPLCYHSTWNITDLRNYVLEQPYLFNMLPSGIGMSRSQIIDSNKRANVRPSHKSINGAYRTLKFLERIYMDRDLLEYLPVENATIQECNDLINQLEKIEVEYNPSLVEYFRNALYNTRINNIK